MFAPLATLAVNEMPIFPIALGALFIALGISFPYWGIFYLRMGRKIRRDDEVPSGIFAFLPYLLRFSPQKVGFFLYIQGSLFIGSGILVLLFGIQMVSWALKEISA